MCKLSSKDRDVTDSCGYRYRSDSERVPVVNDTDILLQGDKSRPNAFKELMKIEVY